MSIHNEAPPSTDFEYDCPDCGERLYEVYTGHNDGPMRVLVCGDCDESVKYTAPER